MAKTALRSPAVESTHRRNQNRFEASIDPAKAAGQAMPVSVLQRKPGCACGGFCPRCNDGGSIQTKLKIGKPGDRYEQEADRVAEQVMRMPDPELRRQPLEEEEEEQIQTRPEITPLIQRQVDPEDEEEEPVQSKFETNIASQLQRQNEEEDEKIQMKPVIHSKILFNKSSINKKEGNPVQHAGRGIESQPSLSKGGGSSLSADVRETMEPRFGMDFSQVRVHTDDVASASARNIGAQAYTLGNHITFSVGKFRPHTIEGKRLLAHELTHVTQQRFINKNNSAIQQKSNIEIIQRQSAVKPPAASAPAEIAETRTPVPVEDPRKTEYDGSEPKSNFYKNVDEYKTDWNLVNSWKIPNPSDYIEEAIEQWNNAKSNKYRKGFLSFNNFLRLKRLYKQERSDIDDPLEWSKNNIVGFTFFNFSIKGSKILKERLKLVEDALNEKNPTIGKKFKLGEGGGAFNPRLMRGSRKLSKHAYGEAIDINPDFNPMFYDRSINFVLQVTGINIRKEHTFDKIKEASKIFVQDFAKWTVEKNKEWKILAQKRDRTKAIRDEVKAYGEEWDREHKQKRKKLSEEEYEKWNSGLKEKMDKLKAEKKKLQKEINGKDIDKLEKILKRVEQSKEYWAELKAKRKEKTLTEELLASKHKRLDEIRTEWSSCANELKQEHKQKNEELSKEEYKKWDDGLIEKKKVLTLERKTTQKEIRPIETTLSQIIEGITKIEKKYIFARNWAKWSEQGFLNLNEVLYEALLASGLKWLVDERHTDIMHFQL